jgi:hypothetical protein
VVISSITGIWTREEDGRLKQLVEEHGTGNWSLIGDFFVDRTGRQCRGRWTNHLRPDLKKGEWTEEVSVKLEVFVCLPFAALLLGFPIVLNRLKPLI